MQNITHYSFQHFFFKNNIGDGWLAEGENKKERRESLTKTSQWWMSVKANHGACAREEEGNVTNNLNYFFPDIKGGRKIDCEASPRTFFCYKWYQYRGVFLS